MNRTPSTESAPQSVSRFLLPHERRVISVRRHPAVLIRPAATTIGGLIVAVLITQASQGDQALAAIVWLLWLILLFRLMMAFTNWTSEYFVSTDQRLLLVSGLFSRNTESLALARVNDMSLRRSPSGNLLGYGTLVFESTDLDAVIEYAPYPEQLYLEISNLLFPDRTEQPDD
jgi:hypothetical protein